MNFEEIIKHIDLDELLRTAFQYNFSVKIYIIRKGNNQPLIFNVPYLEYDLVLEQIKTLISLYPYESIGIYLADPSSYGKKHIHVLVKRQCFPPLPGILVHTY